MQELIKINHENETPQVPILNETQITKITVQNIDTGEKIAVITNEEIITADKSIIVKITPKY